MKAIVFDVDGVLFHSEDSNGNFLWQATIEEDIGLTGDRLKFLFGPKWSEEVITGRLDTRTFFSEALNLGNREDDTDVTVDVDKFIEYWLKKDLIINTEILNLIKRVKVPCYLGTNQDRLRTTRINDLVGSEFNGIFASCDIGHAKPTADFFNYITNELKIEPADIILVDDSAGNVEAARGFGWNAFLFEGNERSLAALQVLLDRLNLI